MRRRPSTAALGFVLAPALLLGAWGLVHRAGAAAPDEAPTRQAPRPRRSPRSEDFTEATYRRMLECARTAVAIVPRGGVRPVATGVRIAPDLVLTCRHATYLDPRVGRRYPADALEVWVDHVEEGSGRRIPVKAYAHTSEALDVCVLRLDLPDDEPEAVCAGLEPGPVSADTPVYVVHHGGGALRRIQDGGVVRHPYRVDARGLDRLLRRAEPAERERLRAAYEADGADFVLRRPRWGRHPAIELATQVPSGASGAPVFCKRSHRLLGIVFAGDTGDPRLARWEPRDAVVPVEVFSEEAHVPR